MKKPEALRRHLEASVPYLRRHPDKLHVRVDSGAVATKPGSTSSFEWRYKLILLFTDVVDQPDTIVVPLLIWLAIHQPELIFDAQKRDKAITFEAEVVNHEAIDIEFTLELSERVIVTQSAGGYLCEHIDEPALPETGGPTGWSMYLPGDTSPLTP